MALLFFGALKYLMCQLFFKESITEVDGLQTKMLEKTHQLSLSKIYKILRIE